MSSNSAAQKYTNWRASNKPYVLAAVAAIIVFMLIAPIVQKGDSMSPTVGDGNVMILNKETYSEKRGLPEYGTVIVFKRDYYDKDKVGGENRVARVIGLPGDKIEISGGDVYRNDKKLAHESYEVGKTTGTVLPIEVPSGQIFILCDNRENSIDSRNDKVGTLSLKSIRGKALIVIWPFSNFGVVK